MKRKEKTKEEALLRLENLCSRSEQCEFELERKMIGWGVRREDRKAILEELRENRYVDDKRFARSYANDKARFSAWGPNKIRMELIKRHIKSSDISEALHGVEQEVWKTGLLRNARSKAKNLQLDLEGEEGYLERQKLYRYLIGRGFPSSAVSAVVKKLSNSSKG